jgi:hypothetical protein
VVVIGPRQYHVTSPRDLHSTFISFFSSVFSFSFLFLSFFNQSMASERRRIQELSALDMPFISGWPPINCAWIFDYRLEEERLRASLNKTIAEYIPAVGGVARKKLDTSLNEEGFDWEIDISNPKGELLVRSSEFEFEDLDRHTLFDLLEGLSISHGEGASMFRAVLLQVPSTTTNPNKVFLIFISAPLPYLLSPPLTITLPLSHSSPSISPCPPSSYLLISLSLSAHTLSLICDGSFLLQSILGISFSHALGDGHSVFMFMNVWSTLYRSSSSSSLVLSLPDNDRSKLSRIAESHPTEVSLQEGEKLGFFLHETLNPIIQLISKPALRIVVTLSKQEVQHYKVRPFFLLSPSRLLVPVLVLLVLVLVLLLLLLFVTFFTQFSFSSSFYPLLGLCDESSSQ